MSLGVWTSSGGPSFLSKERSCDRLAVHPDLDPQRKPAEGDFLCMHGAALDAIENYEYWLKAVILL